jgi:cytochrome P450
MTASTSSEVHYDPYDPQTFANPHPVFRRLREEAPLYYNEQHDFYVLSRYDDVRTGLTDWETYSSARGDGMDLIKASSAGIVRIPRGALLWEDPPVHTMNRKMAQGLFTPRRVLGLEPKIRELTIRILDRLADTDSFDFVSDMGALVPMQAVGMLLGIPEADQEELRKQASAYLSTEPGQPMRVESSTFFHLDKIEGYLDWREKHPSDDLMTALMRQEFEDETGQIRRFTREELLTLVNIVAAAGFDTTMKLIGWAGDLLDRHPEQRRQLVLEPALISNAIEETLRYEPPGPTIARYVARDAEHHGRKVRKGSVMLLCTAAANRDERFFPDGESFDIRRANNHTHLTFAYGHHFCLGVVLARLEARIVLEEVLKRFPEWEVDRKNAKMCSTSTARGWEKLPVFASRAA